MPNVHVQPLFDRTRKLKVGFHFGYAEQTLEGRRFNDAICVGGDGAVLSTYRKVHLRARSSCGGVDAVYALQHICPS